jgi:hypothetical protein
MNCDVIPADTSPKAWRVQLDVFRRMSPLRRLEMALELSATARELVMARVKHRHPDYNPELIRLAVLRLIQGKNRNRSLLRE